MNFELKQYTDEEINAMTSVKLTQEIKIINHFKEKLVYHHIEYGKGRRRYMRDSQVEDMIYDYQREEKRFKDRL